MLHLRAYISLYPPAANPREVAINLASAKYMQEVTSSTCKNSPDDDMAQKQLIDARDGKVYWVAKLKDGNCWMTQNLDYDDPNSVRIEDPTLWADGHYDVANRNYSYRAYYDPGAKIYNKEGLVAATVTVDTHKLVGNYYTFESATNGTASSIATYPNNATGSICPGEWKLPVDSAGNDISTVSFYNLLNQYGFTSTPTNEDNSVLDEPIYWAYSGAIYNSNYFVTDVYSDDSSFTNFWTSGTANSSTARRVFFTENTVRFSSNNNRYIGSSIRCAINGK